VAERGKKERTSLEGSTKRKQLHKDSTEKKKEKVSHFIGGGGVWMSEKKSGITGEKKSLFRRGFFCGEK